MTLCEKIKLAWEIFFPPKSTDESTTLEVNVDQKAFSITIDELFDVVTKIVAHPHTAIVSHDKHRAAKIFLALQDYISNHVQGQEGFGHFVMSEPALDFDTFVENNFNEKDLEQIRNMGS
jgi:hypothetical protein